MVVPLRVLVIEDSPDDAELAILALRREGFDLEWQRVDTEADVLQALATPPDLILADYSLPHLDAQRALQLAKEHAAETPFIVVSGSIGEDMAISMLQQGAADYLLKDRLARLGQAVKRALEEKRLRDERHRAEGLLRTQYDLAMTLSVTVDLDTALRAVLVAACTIEGIDCGGIYLYDAATQSLILMAHTGLTSVFVEAVSYYPGGAPETQLLLAGTRVHLVGAQLQGVPPFAAEGLQAVVAVPVIHEGRLIAALNLGSHGRPEITAAAQQAAEGIAAQIGGTLARIEAEQTLQLNQFTIDHAPIPVVWLIEDGTIVYANQAVLHSMGYSAEEMVGRKMWDFDRRLAPEAWPTHWQNLRTQRVYRAESASLGGDGQSRFLQVIDTYLEYQDREYVVSYILDITERKEIEGRLAQSQKMEAVGRLAGGVAHDFNNLLTVINGYSSMLLEALDPAQPIRADLEQIHQAGQRAVGLTRQLLAFSRRQVMAPHVFDLNELLRGLNKMLGRLIGEDIRLDLALGTDLGLVKADPGQIEQVVMNLAVNSRDAMPDGGVITLTTSNLHVSSDILGRYGIRPAGDYIRLAVSDTGTGMAAEVLEHLFEPFFTTKESGKGTGLGLATVYGIVKQSEGDIDVQSELGRGTTFYIYLPHVVQAADAQADHQATLPGGHETVLVVEDQETVRRLAVRMLRDLGYDVLDAASGPEALRLPPIALQRVDLLLTDVIMPEMNGHELVEQLRGIVPDMRVMYMSGYTDDTLGRHGIIDGAVCLVQKPFTRDVLAQKVREALRAN
jgi:two-component system, cell cycle sensor histidine kinase and response regulator CckA